MAKKNKGVNIFRQVPKAKPPSATFYMGHSVMFDGEFGVAFPISCEEVIAGDQRLMTTEYLSNKAKGQ